MIGGSYDGTTATMVAARGDDVPELKAIVPLAAISRWYGSAYQDGVRFVLNSETPTDEGFDTPLAFDFGFARTPPSDVDDPKAFEKVASRVNPCESVEHTQKGYDTSPDCDAFWRERDYRRHAASFRAATLIGHGWQDYNVKQEEATELFRALPVARGSKPGVPLKRLFMTQDTHASPRGEEGPAAHGVPGPQSARPPHGGREDARGHHRGPHGRRARLRGVVGRLRGSARARAPRSRRCRGCPGRTSGAATGAARRGGRRPRRLPARARALTSAGGPTSEELTTRDPLNEPRHGYASVFFGMAPLERPMRIAGSPVLDATVRTPAGAHLSTVLVDVAPDGTMRTVTRGFLNVDHREGAGRGQAGQPAVGRREGAPPAPGRHAAARPPARVARPVLERRLGDPGHLRAEHHPHRAAAESAPRARACACRSPRRTRRPRPRARTRRSTVSGWPSTSTC